MKIKLQPIITEKSITLAREENIYTFSYIGDKNVKVTKPIVRDMVEQEYDVNVININSNVRLGKEKRFGNSKNTYFTPTRKYFFVKLDDGEEIADFNISEEDKDNE